MTIKEIIYSFIVLVIIFFIGFYFGSKNANKAISNLYTEKIDTTTAKSKDTVYLPSNKEFKYIYKYLPATKDTVLDSNIYTAKFDSVMVEKSDTLELKTFISFNSSVKYFDISQQIKHKFREVLIHDTTKTIIKQPYYIPKDITFFESREFGFAVGSLLTFLLALLLG